MIDRSDNSNAKKRNIISKVDVDFIYLNFTTPEPNGFLLWSSSQSNAEFIGIGIEHEKIKFVWSWEGYNTTVVTPGDNIADGTWHNLTIGFQTPNVTIWMDQRITYNSNASYPGYPPATDGKFFLGGFPKNSTVKNRTFGHFKNGFDGCLQQLAWRTDSYILNFTEFEGENIRTCDLFGV